MTSIIKLTDAAKNATEALIASNPDFQNKLLRVYLAGKGCDGFDYGVTFDSKDVGDHVIPSEGTVDILCDERTLEFVQGSTIDWVDDERGKGYLVNNPSHKKFRGKFYKRESWKNRLQAKE